MAKIFRTEELQVNGDNIRLTASIPGVFEVRNSNGDILLTNADVDSDVSSLQFKNEDLDSDISSLQFKDEDLDSDISSLQFKDEDLDSDVSSLQFKDEDLDSDISSLSKEITRNDTYAHIEPVTSGVSSQVIPLTGRDFEDKIPTVTATLLSEGANDPIMGVMLSGVAYHPVSGFGGASDAGIINATFVFSDEIPNDNYNLQILSAV